MPRCAVCGHVSAEPFKFCPQCGVPPADEPREERKIVTVLFCDVVGSTELGERLDAESVRRVLGRFFETVRDVVERHDNRHDARGDERKTRPKGHGSRST